LLFVVTAVWGMVSDSWGRKTSFGLATLFTTVFGFATAAAPNFHVSKASLKASYSSQQIAA
jgi:MFS family permease